LAQQHRPRDDGDLLAARVLDDEGGFRVAVHGLTDTTRDANARAGREAHGPGSPAKPLVSLGWYLVAAASGAASYVECVRSALRAPRASRGARSQRRRARPARAR